MPTNIHKDNEKRRKQAGGFIEKIVLDAGVGRLSQTPNFEEKALVQVMRDLASITGQKPQIRRARKSIAGFKIRENQIVGLRVTLRRARMVDFFERLIRIVLPRVRDFTGLPPESVDRAGVLNVGIREEFVFPEIAPESSPVAFSLGVAIVPKKRDRAAALREFREMGVPFKRK